MRLFLSIELPDDVGDHLVTVRRQLESVLPKVSYTRPENLHLTLKFLGEVEPKRLDPIKQSLALIKPPRIELAAAGIDCFPNRGPIKIIAAALGGTLAPLRALVESIEQRGKFLGFDREHRAYRPHVTLARTRPVVPAKFREAIDAATRDCWPGPPFAPPAFVLMESQLSPAGSKYSALEQFPINF